MLRSAFFAFCTFVLLTSSAMAHAPRAERTLAQTFPAPPIRAHAGLVMDADTGGVLASVNSHLHLPMASTTKIMTALVALQHGSLTDRIKVPAAAFNFESDATVMGIKPGEIVTLRDLLYGLLLPSGADAANTIAIHYGGSEGGFVTLMNAEAQVLGMHDTHYVNAHGLTAANHFTSAYDLAVLGRYASTIPALMTIVGTKSYTWNGHVLTNLNRPLFWYPGVDGIKPGYTDDAGLCQVLDARRHNRHVIVVLLNTPTLVIDARNYLNYGLRDFTWIQSTLPGDGPSLIQQGVDAKGKYDYFPSSGHYVHSAFLTAYAALGGAAALGFPRTEPLQEGTHMVQYFQNGALARDIGTGAVTRLKLGLTPVPGAPVATPTPIPAPRPTRTPTATPTKVPGEATIVVPSRTGTPRPKATNTPAPRPVATVTPTAHPKPTVTARPTTAAPFAQFFQKHRGLLGDPVAAPYHIGVRTVQIFTYGALVYNAAARVALLLPIGDRLLAARHFLPAHRGTAYPAGFASTDAIKAIGWMATPAAAGH